MKKLTQFLTIGILSMPFFVSQPVDAFKFFGKKSAEVKNAENAKDASEKMVDKPVNKPTSTKSSTDNKQSGNTPKQTDTGIGTSTSNGQSDSGAAPTGVVNSDAAPALDKGKETSTSNGQSDSGAAPTGVVNSAASPVANTVDKDVAVVFTDGSKIDKSVVNAELSNIPLEISARMPYAELLHLISFKLAYQKIINAKATEMKLADDPKVREAMDARRKSYASSKYLNDQVNKIMTNAELEKYYNEMWDKHMKGTNEVSGIMISVQSKEQADKISKIKSEKELNTVISEYKNSKTPIASQPFEVPESVLPPDIIKQIKAKGSSNIVVGPFNIQGMSMFLFVKSVHLAVKKPFNNEIREQYKQIAHREFANRYVNKLMEDRKVVIYDLHGKPIDFKAQETPDKTKSEKKEPVNLSAIKDDFVIAKIGDKETLKISDLYKIYNIKSVENELFASMSVQLKVTMEEVIQGAIKLCVQDKLIEKEMEKDKFMESKDIKEKFEQINAQQLRRSYFNKIVKITESDARKEFNKYLETIKPKDKDDLEISVRLIFYATENDANKAVKKYVSNPKSFSKDFEDAAKNKSAIDMSYIRKVPATSPLSPIWEAVKIINPATCGQKILKLNGEMFGIKDKNFAVAYVGDRRQIKLPTFQETQAFFRKVAEKMQAIAIVEKLMREEIISVDGILMDAYKPADVRKFLVNIVTEDSELSIERGLDR